MKHRLLFLLVLVGGSALDIWSKGWAFDAVEANLGPIEVVDEVFYIDRAENPGAMWSLFEGTPRQVWIGIRGGVFLLLLTFYLRSRLVKGWEHVAYGLVMAGAVGNVWDNLFHDQGCVRDWIRVHFLMWDPWPLFNVADSLVFCGAPLLLWHFHVADRRARAEAENGKGGGSSSKKDSTAEASA